MKIIVYPSLLLLGAASAIKIKEVIPSQVGVNQGGSFAVICKADDWYERCTFRKGEKSCDIMWTWGTNIELDKCDFDGRVELKGRYADHEGGIELSGADADDDGEWSCEFESWGRNRNRVRGDGEIVKKTFMVDVEIHKTTTTTTATTKTTPEPTTTKSTFAAQNRNDKTGSSIVTIVIALCIIIMRSVANNMCDVE